MAHQTGFAISYSVTNIKPVYTATFQCYDLNAAHPVEYDGTRGGQVRFEYDGSDLKVTRDWEKNYSRTGEFPNAVVVGAQAALKNYLEGRKK